MKIRTILCFLFFISSLSNAAVVSNPIIPVLSDLSVCDQNYDGIEIFDLSVQTPIILAAQTTAATDYNVTYHLTIIDAITGSLPIPSNSYMNISNHQTIYVRVENINTSENAVGSFVLIVNGPPSIFYNATFQSCDDSVEDGMTAFNLMSLTSTILFGQTGINVSYYPSYSDAIADTNVIVNFSSYINTVAYSQIIGFRAVNVSTGCTSISSATLVVNPRPTINTPPNFSTCDSDAVNDGYYPYDLSALIPTILGSQSPSSFSVSFYENQLSAENEVNAITNLVNYQTYTHTIWVKVRNNMTACSKISNFNTIVEQRPAPQINALSNSICVDYLTNNMLANTILSVFNTTNYLSQSSPIYTYQWYFNGLPIIGATSSSYQVNAPFSNSQSGNFSVQMTSTSILGCNAISSPILINQSGPAAPIGIGYSIENNAGNQTITVAVEGYGSYAYNLDNGPLQTSPIFQNVSLGNHSLTVIDLEGCGSILIDNINVNLTVTPPPTGNSVQTFNQGATLADLLVTGQNIQWYSGSNKNSVSSLLPLNTVLLDGGTYYASQKIGGYESISRLAVTTQLILANSEFELNNLSFAPNPVSDILKIKSDEIIDEISVYNFLGQVVLNKKIKGSEIEIDLTLLNSANYFVKVTSGVKNSILKIVKY